MDKNEIKCSTQNHENHKAYKYCQECNKFICNQCFSNHKKSLENHHLIDISEDIFISYICKEHLNKLEYFCKSDNKLCCESCKENDHINCDICKIEDIREEKKNNLDKIFNECENISKNIKEKIDNARNFYDKADSLKDDLKSKLLKIITILRNKLNEREDELISELNKIFETLYPEEKLIINYEKIPKKINNILNQRNSIDKNYNDLFLLNSYISDCINIEKEYNEIIKINDSINKYDIHKEIKVSFYPDKESEDFNKLIKDIKSFGKIYHQEIETKKDFAIESYKIIYELKSEIEKLKSELSKKNKEYKQLEEKFDEINSDLNDERRKNNNLKNTLDELKNSKIEFTIRSRCALHKCLDMKSLNYGNSPHLWDYGHHNANQIFVLEKNYDGTYSIKSSRSGLYLGIDSNDITFRWKNENKQSFYLHHYGDGYYLIQEKSGSVIDLYSSNTNNGAKIGKWSRNNDNNQQWKFVIHL